MTVRAIPILLSLSLSFPSAIEAQNPKAATAPLTFRCSFPVNANADMRQAPAKVAIARDAFELVFDQVNPVKGTGRMIGNNGGVDVIVIDATEVITILERTPSGVVQLTAIYSARQQDGTFKAVHSRHSAAFGGEPIPSQYYGSCKSLS